MSPVPTLARNVWQPVPGWSGGEVFPIVIRPGIVCSNTYLLDTARAMVVIDPGTDPAQIELINRTLAERPGADDKPVLVILSHCHQDHSQCADQVRIPARAPNLLLVEESGAQALREGNRERTLAMLYPENPPVCLRSADVDLFASGSPQRRALHDGVAGQLAIEAPTLPAATLPIRQSLDLGGGNWLHIHRTPGHTPCSLCVQAGALLFVGDLPYAADPGLIGIDGWNQADLLRSFDGVERLMREQKISICCPGHGNPMPADVLHRALVTLQEETMGLEDVDTLDIDRLNVLKEFAGELLEEAEYLFSVISGRLYAVSFHLANLEETAEAERFSEALDLAKIDRVLGGFRAFHDEFRAAEQPTLSLVMKGVQTARAIEQVFEAHKLQALLDASLVRRASRLLADYVALVRGMRFAGTESTPDLERLVAELVHGLDMRKLDSDKFIDSADDAEAYLMGLVARLAFPPAFRNVRIEFHPRGVDIDVPVAPDRLGDIIVSLLESVAASGAGEIRIECEESDDRVRLRISGAAAVETVTLRRMDISRRVLAPLGGRLHLQKETDGGDCFLIDLPRTGASLKPRLELADIH